MRAFNQTRHVANREPVQVGIFDDADLRVQRGERIRRDFRPRLGNGREQRGLARVRIADQPDFGHDAQFEKKIAFLARLARLRETRRLARRGGKIPVAQAAASAFAKHELLAVFSEIGDQFALCLNRRRNILQPLPCSNQFPAPVRRWHCESMAVCSRWF